jgi:hypothetical protein
VNGFVRQQLLGAAARADRAGLEQMGAVDDPQHLVDVLLDDQHRQPAGADAFEEGEDLLHDNRRETRRGFVEQQEPRLRHQRATDRAHLLLAAGQRSGELPAPLFEAREELVDKGEAVAEFRASPGCERPDAEFCRAAEANPRVRAYVKNQGLGFEVPHLLGAMPKKYLPNFIVRVERAVAGDAA